MKKVLEQTSKIALTVLGCFFILGIVLFVYDSSPDVLGSIQTWDDIAQQTAIWLGVCVGLSAFILLHPGSWRTYDKDGNLVSRVR